MRFVSADSLLGEVARFLAAGVGNTLLTIGVYQIALSFAAPLTAYVIAWAVGVALVALFYPRFVYRRGANWRGAATMIAVYAAAFCLGALITYLCERAGIPPRAIIFISAAITAAFSYLAGRYALGAAGASTVVVNHDRRA